MLRGNSKYQIDLVSDYLRTRFKVRVVDKESNVLGMATEDVYNGVLVHSAGNAEKLLNHLTMKKCNYASVPLQQGFSVQPASSYPLQDIKSCRKFVGCLNYLTSKVPPDIYYATN